MKFKRTVLGNGMKVITVHMKEMPTVTVLVMAEVGSKYETKNISGLSHFLEHMCFKGTVKRPTAFSISRELDAIGAQYNAFTSEEYTGYYAKSASKHASKILDVISDIYLNPIFDEKEIEKEKGVIIEEINMYKDLPHRHVQELFMKLLYGDQPVGWGVAGTRESVSALTRENFLNYKNEHYVGKGTTLIIAGNFNGKNIQKEIAERFKTIPNKNKKQKVKVKEIQHKPEFILESRKTDQTHIVLGFRGVDVAHPDTPAFRLLNAVLGAGMSSRLFQKLREEMGVGYYVHSSYDAYNDHGVLSVSVGADSARVVEVVKAILVELTKFKTNLVSEEELTKTKDYISGMMFLGLESSDSIAEFYGFQEVLGRPLREPSQALKEIQALTSKDIMRVAKKYFSSKHLNLAIVGPLKQKDQKALKAILTI